jgi:hypothetical protein
VIFGSIGLNSKRPYAQISTLKNSGIFFLPYSGGFGGAPQSFSGLPECECEDRNHDSSECQNIFVIDTLPDEIDKPRNPLKEGGAGLQLDVSIGGLMLAYQYAKGKL